MSIKYLSPIDLTQQELQNAVVQNLGVAPGAPTKGQIYFDSAANKMKVHNGTAFETVIGSVSGNFVSGITLNQPGAGLTVTNDGSSQIGAVSYTFALTDDLAALENLATFGLAARTAASTWVSRTITGTTNQVTVVDGGGVGGNPTLSLPQDIHTAATPTFSQVTLSATAPTNPSHAVRKDYVDSLINGLDWKASVRAATSVAGTLASSFANGSMIDTNVTLVTGDRILLKNQVVAGENGIWIVAATGAPTRALDAATWANLVSSVVPVEIGAANADTVWYSSADQGGTIGTTDPTYSQMPTPMQVLAGAGIQKNGNTFDVGVDNSSLEISSDALRVKALGITNAMILGGTIDLTAKVTGILPIANGGSGQSTQAAAITALTGAQTSGKYLRSDGTNSTLSALQLADLPAAAPLASPALTGTPTSTTATPGTNTTQIATTAFVAAFTGTSNIVTVGTITSGVWTGTTIAVANGGTGATNAAAARANLSAAVLGANGDITSLSGLTTALSVAQGGTGATTAPAARTNLGATTKYAANFGDGTATSFSLTHGLGSADIVVRFSAVATGQTVEIDYTVTATLITFTLPVAPTASQYRVIAVG